MCGLSILTCYNLDSSQLTAQNLMVCLLLRPPSGTNKTCDYPFDRAIVATSEITITHRMEYKYSVPLVTDAIKCDKLLFSLKILSEDTCWESQPGCLDPAIEDLIWFSLYTIHFATLPWTVIWSYLEIIVLTVDYASRNWLRFWHNWYKHVSRCLN